MSYSSGASTISRRLCGAFATSPSGGSPPTRFMTQRKLSLLAASALALIASSAMAAQVKDAYLDFDGGPQWLPAATDGLSGAQTTGAALRSLPQNQSPASAVGLTFKGVSQFDLRNILGGSFIPPDTMGAIGASQFMETTNGVYAVYSKASGALQSMVDARAFWAAAGMSDGSGLNGDARVLFDKSSQKWIALQFGASVADIQIAVSTTSNALGAWRSTKFTGFAGGTADYPTLAIDQKAIYIGTNNFDGSDSFAGTTLNVISRSDLLGGGAPTTASLKQFYTPFPGTGEDRGFAIQGVNNSGPDSGHVIAASVFSNDSIRYNVANPGTAGATTGPVTFLGLTNYAISNGGGRQPDGTRNIDPLDQRIGASVWEQNGKIYAVYTATKVGGDHTEVRWIVSNAATNAVIQEGVIGDATHDFYEGSLTVNAAGQVVIGYNRSGFSAADGKVSFLARTYNSNAGGQLVQTNELLLHVSAVDDYHNGSVEGAPAKGPQRWGDYSAVTLDPNNDQSFWAIGEYAEVWNNVGGCSPGHPPGCTLSGGSSWGTWISEINLAPVPEPGTYAIMIAGLLALGAMSRRKATKA